MGDMLGMYTPVHPGYGRHARSVTLLYTPGMGGMLGGLPLYIPGYGRHAGYIPPYHTLEYTHPGVHIPTLPPWVYLLLSTAVLVTAASLHVAG